VNRFRVALVGIDAVRNDRSVPEWVGERLAAGQIEFVNNQCDDRETLIAAAADADVVWVSGGGRMVTAETLGDLRRCKALLRTGAGADNMPVQEATRRGILVVNTPQATEDAVSDHAIALLLSIYRWIPRHDRAMHEGGWDRELAWPDWHFSGATLGLVGFGRSGRAVARKLSGFDIRIIACDPYVDAERMAAQAVRKATLDELLEESDFVSIHTPLADETRHLIGDRELGLMKAMAILINTSRGPVVDEAALVRALEEGRIGAAGLDVFETEPPLPDNPLLRMDNVVMTPHVACQSERFAHDSWRYSVEALVDMANGRLPESFVNPQVVSRCPFKPR